VEGSGAARRAWVGHLLAAAELIATGAWIAPLSPEAAFDPNHIDTLLSVLIENDLEFVYGQAVVDLGAGRQAILGAWPPKPDGVFTIGTELYSSRLREVAPFDSEAWRDAETSGWAKWRCLADAGVRMASIEAPVTWLTDATAGPGKRDRSGAAADLELSADPASAASEHTFRDRRTRRREARHVQRSAATTSRG
jgi:hypothetical protein